MQDARTLKQFFQSATPIALAIGDNKAELVSQLIAHTNPAHMLLRKKATPHLKPDTLIHTLSQHWAIQFNKTLETTLHQQFTQALDCLRSQAQGCVLLIEHAHVLSQDMMDALCQLSALQNAEEAPRLRIILQGQAELARKLTEPVFSMLLPALLKQSRAVSARSRTSLKRSAVLLSAIGLIVCAGWYWKIRTNDIISYAQHTQAVIQHFLHARLV